MENASKALIIAGEILIAILILTLGVQIISSYRSTSKAQSQRMSSQQIEAFNSKFLKYIEYDSTENAYITAQNLITIARLAEESKEQGITIDIICDGKVNKDLAEYILANRDSMFRKIGSKIYIVYYRIIGNIQYNEGVITQINFDQMCIKNDDSSFTNI